MRCYVGPISRRVPRYQVSDATHELVLVLERAHRRPLLHIIELLLCAVVKLDVSVCSSRASFLLIFPEKRTNGDDVGLTGARTRTSTRQLGVQVCTLGRATYKSIPGSTTGNAMMGRDASSGGGWCGRGAWGGWSRAELVVAVGCKAEVESLC
jgi:hypothetical protein